jgi:hypothetical protein
MAFGRHTESSRRRLIITIAAFVVALTPAAVGLWMIRPGQQTTPSESTLAAATAATQAAKPSVTVAGEAAGGQADTQDGAELTPAEVTWWAACQKQESTGTALVAAQGEAATHWGEHVAAQQDLDARKITGEQAKARWAASKVFGPADVANAAAAAKAHQDAGTGCGDPPPSPDPTRQAQAVACSGWVTEQARVIERGEVVVNQWAAHLDMMGRKGEMDTGRYLGMWREMVDGAVIPLAAFEDAEGALGAASACTPPAT